MRIMDDLLQSFYSPEKSIQRAYSFAVDFNITSPGNSDNVTSNDLEARFGDSYVIQPYHVKTVVLPQQTFKKEIQKIGIFPKTFPVLETDGLELRIDFEEDATHTIKTFILYLQKRIISERGIYQYPSLAKIPSIVVYVNDAQNNVVASYKFVDCFFLNVTEPTYSYASNEAIGYNVTFGCDYYELTLYGNS